MSDTLRHVHIINKFGNVFGGSERRAIRLAQILRKHADVKLWATHPPDPRLLAITKITAINPWRLAFPRTGIFIFVGVYFHVGHWIQLTHPRRKIVILNTDDTAGAQKMIRHLSRDAGIGNCEIVYSSAKLQARFSHPGTVEPSPIDIDAFLPARKASVADAPFVVGRLSRDYRYKFHEDDPALFRRLSDSGIHLRLMGGNCVSSELADVANVDIIENGAVSAPDFLHSLDCFLYRTSSHWFESYGRVVFEAMASGLPVVCASAGGYADRIEHGVNGYLFDTDEEAFAIVENLRRDPALRQKIGNAAHKKMAENYSSAYERRLVDFYLAKSSVAVASCDAVGK